MNQIQSDQINELVKALIEAHKEISHATMDSKNPHFKSEFASLEAVIDATKNAYLRHNCILMQLPILTTLGPVLITQITHTSGQWIRSETPILSKDQGDPQKMGSGLSYARRYAIAAISNIGQKDDDGNHASSGSPVETHRVPGNRPDPEDLIFPFPFPAGFRGKRLKDLGVDGIMQAGKSLAQWKQKTEKEKTPFPENAQMFMDVMRDMLKKPQGGNHGSHETD